MENLFDYECDEQNLEFDCEISDLVDEAYFTEEIDPMEFLNQFDYNLNSPVINDHIEELEKYLKNELYNRIWERPSWSTIKQASHQMNWQLNLGKDSWKYHAFAFRLLEDFKGTGKFMKFLSSTIKSSQSTGTVLQSFLRDWAGYDWNSASHYDPTLIEKLGPDCLRWGDLFLMSHVLVLHMNATGIKEKLNLKKLFKGQLLFLPGRSSQNSDSFFLLDIIGFGKVAIFEGYVIFLNIGMLLDRNMLLMIKDICISRVQVCISLLYNTDDIGHKMYRVSSLVNLYRLGDRYLSYTKNAGYDGIKLLEPICNLQLCKLARNYRPLIPEFPEFEQHVKRSIIDKSGGSTLLQEISDLVTRETNVKQVLTYYSVFRHWGHPDIDYDEGLEKLYTQTTMNKNIDDTYAQALGSDLAFKVLKKMYFEKKKWFVDPAKVANNHPLYPHIINNTWPNQYQIEEFGDHWHELPIVKIYDLPDLVDPSIIYSDKSHSMQRSEVLDWIKRNPNKAVPSKRVLQTLLSKEETNWVEFLQEINDYGLNWDDLVIGLKAKEREMKRIGRFFSLMSWKLREYFVYTEYLIKEYFVPLFKGLTMADDLQEVIKKMLENVSGQGLSDYSFISIANHIDYEKWNNHQRYESNQYVFRVMGQCFGLENLFLRTHEFFQKSLVYYASRPDLIQVIGDTASPIGQTRACWEGQAGGLEGLRQKGWSILNLLVIERESKIRNTLVKVLAQGDNQTISTCYEVDQCHTVDELVNEIQKITRNNSAVMSAIKRGTEKLGLIINEDETMVSADYLNYGKVPIFRGIIRGLDEKRWARVNFGTNDQVPSLGSLLSSVSTNALTVSHFSTNPLNAMVLHNLFANMTYDLLKIYNPALRNSLQSVIKDTELLLSNEFRILLIYLDPSLGGIGGTSLTRFLIRAFPDAVTESLTFWKSIAESTHSDQSLRSLAVQVGYPNLADFQVEHLSKLIENPTSLNIIRGISATNLLKNEVKKNLLESRSRIGNKIVRSSLDYMHQNEEEIMAWMYKVKPLFPRFLSEFISSTYYGITKSIVGLFQNSRTIRTQFRKRYSKRIDDVVCKSEIIGICSLIHIIKKSKIENRGLWVCSAYHADSLRQLSWGTNVLGTTVPHPFEMIKTIDNMHNECAGCRSGDSTYLSVLVPRGLGAVETERGPYPPYLGSRTSETTSLIQPWEKETNIPLLKRAVKMRNAISWFVHPDSKLSQTILGNLEALTGEKWEGRQTGFKRTGSALHRFTCSRQSNGGFSATAPTNLTWMICTTDTMDGISGKNYDFMFQSLIVYAQATTGLFWKGNNEPLNAHFHINCKSCLREITEPWLDCPWILNFPKVSHIIKAWRPNPEAPWGTEKAKFDLKKQDWEKLKAPEQSYHIGHMMGFVYTDMLLSHSKHVNDSSLFPLGIRDKLCPKEFFIGLFLGVQRAGSLHLIHRRNLIELKKPRIAQWGLSFYVTEELSKNTAFLGFIRDGPLHQTILQTPHKIPSSYPLNNIDLGSIFRTYFKTLLTHWYNGAIKLDLNKSIWVFSDFQTHELMGSIALSRETLKLIMGQKSKHFTDSIRKIQEVYINIKNDNWELINLPQLSEFLISTPQELRHAVKFGITPVVADLTFQNWGEEIIGKCFEYVIKYDTVEKKPFQPMIVPRRTFPLLSSLRLNQLATGAHYKIRTILSSYDIKWDFAICGGDGSGGITSYLCRSNPTGKVLFNSLIILDGVDLKGSHPSPPSAILALGSERFRCINLTDAWQHPSDLTKRSTWNYFSGVSIKSREKFDLMIFDMEVVDEISIEQIENHLREFSLQILREHGSIIFKSYVERIINKHAIIDKIGPQFERVFAVQTTFSSNYTSEVYIVFYKFKGGIIPPQFPDKLDLSLELSKCFCFSNHQSELRRCREVLLMDMYKGVPPELISDPALDLSTSLVIAGLESGYAMSITKSASRYRSDPCSYLIAVTALVTEANLNTTRNVGQITVPSNKDAGYVLAHTVALWIWVALQTNSLELYSQSYEMMNQKTLLSVGVHLKKDKTFMKWSTCERLLVSKEIRVGRMSAHIGQLIRLFVKLFGVGKCRPDRSRIEKILQFYNRRLTFDHLVHHTDILGFLRFY